MKQRILEQGQALMMVILVMFVGLTMVLIIFMNSLADLRLSTVEEESERAFSVAETGIENILADDLSNIGDGQTTDFGDSHFTANINTAALRSYEYQIKQNDTGEIQLQGSAATNPTSKVYIYWTKRDSTESNGEYPEGASCTGSLWAAGLIVEKWSQNVVAEAIPQGESASQVLGVTTEEGNMVVTRMTYQPYGCASALQGEDNSTAGNFSDDGKKWNFASTGDSKGYLSSVEIPIDSTKDIMIRIRPIYNNASFMAVGEDGKELPIQQHQFTSGAQVKTTGESRALQVVRTVPQLPGIFDYVLFSGENPIVK